MHQHPRPAVRLASSANPASANISFGAISQREGLPSRTPSSQDLTAEMDRPGSRAAQEMRALSDDEKSRINQIIQHFFSKSTLTILSSRVTLASIPLRNGEPRIDRWFNTQLEDTDALNQDLREWKFAECFRERPAPLIIEVYLDTTQLAQNQSLVAMDEEGRPWDVTEALQELAASNPSAQTPTKLVYERWTIKLDDTTSPSPFANDTAPGIYKRGVVAIRSLFTYTRYLPAWRFGRRIGRNAGNGPMLKPRYRILNPSLPSRTSYDTLTCPLFPSDQPASETFHFEPFDCSAGLLKTSVTYRRNCDFLVEPTERLLSTKAMRSASRQSRRPEPEQAQNCNLPARSLTEPSSYKQSQRPVTGRPDPPEASLPARPSRLSADLSAARNAPVLRRTSVSFQPFKAGSLSSSPGTVNLVASPSSSVGRGTSLSSSHARSRSSLTTVPQQVLRTPQLAGEAIAASSGSSSPKPAPLQRYSSSFSNRRSRFPSSGSIRGDDDNLSSGRGSVSSVPRDSGSLPTADASLASAHADDDNIQDFIKLLDRNKGLASFAKTDQTEASQRTAAQYSKFARMRDSTAQLTDSMSSSLMIHRSSSSSSRQLHNVPGMIAGSSFSTSSSPGKPISPHTPHMPAIPSRLSNNSIIADYSREASRSRPIASRARNSSDGTRVRSPMPSHGTPASTAIDIPTSPRTFPAGRRSSSVAQQPRIRPEVDEQDGLSYELRSASLPNEQAELSLSELLTQTDSGASVVARRRREMGTSTAAADDDDEPLLFALAE
ncbi:hypothetical protein AAFC00_006790 [Neodothiora populina]|uniref:Autophagy-related protein 13 n=1 Tax=Neodothiora populina TaxID=2781224 RepID=A0ABR3PBT7_9PEZI